MADAVFPLAHTVFQKPHNTEQIADKKFSLSAFPFFFTVHKPQGRHVLRGQRLSKCNTVIFLLVLCRFKSRFMSYGQLSPMNILYITITAESDGRHVKQLQAHNYPLCATNVHIHDKQYPKLFSPAHDRGRRKLCCFLPRFIIYLDCFACTACTGVNASEIAQSLIFPAF